MPASSEAPADFWQPGVLKHSPGPWRLEDTRGLVSQSRHEPCCDPEVEANAILIAAAPDMLRALRMMKAACGDASNWNGDTHAFIVAADAAIAKAEGRL